MLQLTVAVLASAWLACGGKTSLDGAAGAAGAAGAGGQERCTSGAPSQSFVAGTYFALWEIETPLDTQVQIFASMVYDPATGEVVAQLTNADRNPNLDCPLDCDPDTEVCSPSLGECVWPSKRATSEDDYAEWLPNATPPTGYSATMWGCVYERSSGAELINDPFDLVVQSPPVTFQAIDIGGTFSSVDGVMRGSGALLGDDLFLGTTPNGPFGGTHRERLIPPDEVPPGVPQPPAGAPDR